jgi:hypothetical protein
VRRGARQGRGQVYEVHPCYAHGMKLEHILAPNHDCSIMIKDSKTTADVTNEF